MPQDRPSIPRDTRLLLTIVVTAVLMLWVLARVRFPDRPRTPNPVPPVLAQLAPPSALDDMVSVVSQLQTRLEPSMLPVEVVADASRGTTVTLPAIRFRGDLALLLTPRPVFGRSAAAGDIQPVAWDAASNLAVVKIGDDGAPGLSSWTPRRLSAPRFLVAGAAFEGTVSLRPVFVASLVERPSPVWSGDVWVLPPAAGLRPGTLVFNVDGAWAGVAAAADGRDAIVPADTVLAIAERLVRDGQPDRGWLGIQAEPLTPALLAATGASGGVIVAWIDPAGPAAGQLDVGDSLETMDGQPIASADDWRARTSRLVAGAPVTIGVRHQGTMREIKLTAQAGRKPSPRRPLGLVLRTASKAGAEIVRIDPGSAAEEAGLVAGDVLTLVGDVAAPTARQALRVFDTASRDRPILVGIARGDAHLVLAIERTW